MGGTGEVCVLNSKRSTFIPAQQELPVLLLYGAQDGSTAPPNSHQRPAPALSRGAVTHGNHNPAGVHLTQQTHTPTWGRQLGPPLAHIQ